MAVSALKTIFSVIAVATLSYFAPGLGTALAAKLGITSAFVSAVIGATIVAVGLYGIQTIMGTGKRGTDMEAGKVNVRIGEPLRWMNIGRCRQGGGVLFAEFDGAGNFWYLIVHSDSILTETLQYFLDDMPVTVDGSGVVLNPEFRLKDNKEKDPATISGEGIGYVQLWTTTYTETDPTPPAVSALAAAFPSLWTADHKLVGTTFTVIKIGALPIEHRSKIYKWRGAIGVGEPAVSVVGMWANAYDPRDETQTLGDRTTYKPTRNAALVWAWFRTHPYGRNKSETSINWSKIAEQADICDQAVTGIEGDAPRYTCDATIPEDKSRAIAEQEILMSSDAQLFFDDDGKTWIKVGYWEAPTLALYRNRDILAMESVEAQNGESETQGVIVRYTDPDSNYSVQPSAAWLNPNFYVEGERPLFLTVDILTIQNHNQAMRLAKAIGMRSQPLHKLGPTVGLRGLRARQERITNLLYDNTFSGDYEIVTPVEVDPQGVICGFGLVPVDQYRWTLLEGEEQSKPVPTPGGGAGIYPAITGETVTYSDGIIMLTFPALPRPDASYLAQHIETALITGADSDPWIPMTVNDTVATSGTVAEGTTYTVRRRYITTAGNGPDWESSTITPTISIEQPSLFGVTDGTGKVDITWRNPTDSRFSYIRIYENSVTTLGTATSIAGDVTGALGASGTYSRTVAPGTRYYWLRAFDGSGNSSAAVGPLTGVSS